MLIKPKTIPKYPVYKDSGVEWLGDIPEHWKANRIASFFKERKKKVTDIIYRPLSVTKNGVLKQLGYVAKSKDGENRKLVKEGDFVINSRSDRKGSSGLSRLNGSVSLINIVLKPKNIVGDYINYLFKSNSFVEENYRIGHGIVADLWTTRYDEMKNIKITIPPISEQTAIAQFLDEKTTKIDQAIAQKEKMIELLKERKQIIIQNAVTGKVVWSEKQQKMIPLAQSEFQGKDSGVEWIGEIPKHWEVKRLKYLGNLFSGLSGKAGNDFSKELEKGFKPFVPFTSIFRDKKIEEKLHQFVRVSEEENQNRVKNDDILFLMSSETLDDIGKCSIYKGTIDELYLNSFCKGFRCSKGAIFPSYLNDLLQSDSYRNYFATVGRGFTRINIKQDYVLGMNVIIPPKKEQIEIVKHIEEISNKNSSAVINQKKQIEKLKEYKATLIDSAVRGKIKVC